MQIAETRSFATIAVPPNQTPAPLRAPHDDALAYSCCCGVMVVAVVVVAMIAMAYGEISNDD